MAVVRPIPTPAIERRRRPSIAQSGEPPSSIANLLGWLLLYSSGRQSLPAAPSIRLQPGAWIKSLEAIPGPQPDRDILQPDEVIQPQSQVRVVVSRLGRSHLHSHQPDLRRNAPLGRSLLEPLELSVQVRPVEILLVVLAAGCAGDAPRSPPFTALLP